VKSAYKLGFAFFADSIANRQLLIDRRATHGANSIIAFSRSRASCALSRAVFVTCRAHFFRRPPFDRWGDDARRSDRKDPRKVAQQLSRLVERIFVSSFQLLLLLLRQRIVKKMGKRISPAED
jgi:hypothetical protein